MKYIKGFRQAVSAIIDDLELRCPGWTNEMLRTDRALASNLRLAHISTYGAEAVDAAIEFLSRPE